METGTEGTGKACPLLPGHGPNPLGSYSWLHARGHAGASIGGMGVS
ncbi:MAG: hypothetical protein OJF50_006679 [Nitrospira sp.]|nr:hypothetical protein [Nitrospira sp.]